MIKIFKELFSEKEILKGNFGIEREALRVTNDGKLSKTPHPMEFGEKISNPYITTDFSESQVEMVTPTFSTSKELYDFANVLYDIVALNIGDEYLWPQSMPCNIPEDSDIPIAQFGTSKDGIEATKYRENLIKKYGGKKQLISGIHYNFSFEDAFIEKLRKKLDPDSDFKNFKNAFYLKCTRNYLRYRWLLIYLLGGTAIIHESYSEECTKKLRKLQKESFSNKGSISYRNSECGYENKIDLFPCYDSLDCYIKSIKNFINEGLIESPKELYTQIRVKPKDARKLFKSLEEDGIQYLEMRSIDINPFEKCGISLDDLKFMHLFAIYIAMKEESAYELWQEDGLYNQRIIAKFGQNNIFLKKDGVEIEKNKYALSILEEIKEIDRAFNIGEHGNIQRIIEKIKNPRLTYASKITEKVKKEGYIDAHIDLAKEYHNEAYKARFKMQGYEDMELSTQILMKEAIKRGIKVEILDRVENFIKLSTKNKTEYVIQATKTSLDSYSTILIMENKVVTKKVLHENGINVPLGMEFDCLPSALDEIETFVDKPIVIKPKSTNFGKGISIFPNGAHRESIEEGMKLAFSEDKTILVEHFVKGKEYRFLVVGDEAIGVLHRVPANVIGDGIHSIKSLVDEKNKSYLRGKGYKTPLEKINLDEYVNLFLSQSNLTVDYIPGEGEIVYLRENSNISTGGDSIDYTDDMPQRFKDIAVASSKAVGAKICGVDLMIEDYTDENSNYSIIELNFNPAIHIHSFPYKGTERKIAEKVLRLLGFIK